MTLKECLEHILDVSECNYQFFESHKALIDKTNRQAVINNVLYLVSYQRVRDLTRMWLNDLGLSDPEAEIEIMRNLFYLYVYHDYDRDFALVFKDIVHQLADVITRRDDRNPDHLFLFDEDMWQKCVLGW